MSNLSGLPPTYAARAMQAAFADACEWNVLRLPRPPYDYACTICVAAARSGPLDDSTIGEVSSLLRQVMAAAQAGPVDEEEDGAKKKGSSKTPPKGKK